MMALRALKAVDRTARAMLYSALAVIVLPVLIGGRTSITGSATPHQSGSVTGSVDRSAYEVESPNVAADSSRHADPAGINGEPGGITDHDWAASPVRMRPISIWSKLRTLFQ